MRNPNPPGLVAVMITSQFKGLFPFEVLQKIAEAVRTSDQTISRSSGKSNVHPVDLPDSARRRSLLCQKLQEGAQ